MLHNNNLRCDFAQKKSRKSRKTKL